MSSEIYRGILAIEAKTVGDWRKWLAANFAKQDSVWLIIYRKECGIPSVYYSEAVDEALCYGWVDSKPNKRDDRSYYQYFAKRNPMSNWSRVNKQKVERLFEEGKMAEPGLEMIRIAKANGAWSALDEVENLVLPDDLRAEFEKYPGALNHWEDFPRSVKRGILEWIFNAKKPETRRKRISETVEKALMNERANQYSRK